MTTVEIAMNLLESLQKIFPESKINQINDEILDMKKDKEDNIKIEITESIKCYLLTIQYIITKENYIYPDNIQKWLDMAKSDAAYYMSKIDPESLSDIIDNFSDIDNETKKKARLNFNGSIEEKRLFDKWIDSELNEQEKKDLFISQNFTSAMSFTYCMEKMQELNSARSDMQYNEEDELSSIYISQCVYTKYKNQYDQLKFIGGKNVFEQCLGAIVAICGQEENCNWEIYTELLNYFNIYEHSSSEDTWELIDDFFESQFSNDPHERQLFLQFLSLSEEEGGSPYVNDFCDEVESYYHSLNKKIPFDFAIIPSRIKLECDSDPLHIDWFEKIPLSKYGNNTNNILYKKIKKLYQTLKQQELINCSEDLFIYRLSGLGDIQFEPNVEICWKGTPRELGFLILGLFQYYDHKNNKIISPHYSHIQKYFGIKSNIKSVGQNWQNNKTWLKTKKMLEDCGFFNIDVVVDDKF